jgi:hypothetical protein
MHQYDVNCKCDACKSKTEWKKISLEDRDRILFPYLYLPVVGPNGGFYHRVEGK